MKYFRNKMDVSINEPTAITLGKFDGVHRGHTYLIAHLRKLQKERGYKSVIFTFVKPPKDEIEQSTHEILSTINEKEKELEEYKTKVDAIMKEKTIADSKAQFISLGYSEQLALESAKALVDGDTSKVFENQKIFNDELAKKLQADLVKNTPSPAGGNGGGDKVVTQEMFDKMNYQEQVTFYNEHPEEYAKFTQKN